MKSLLDKSFVYHGSKTHHGSAEAFAQRQRDRLAQVRAAAASKVQPIKRKGEK
jgi:hypothetical protein